MKRLATLLFFLSSLFAKAQTCVSNSSSLNFNNPSTGTQHVSFTTDNGLIISDSITIEAWINASQWASSAAQGSIFCKHSWANGEQGFVLRAGGNGQLSFTIAGDSMGVPTSWKDLTSSSSAMVTNTWYHVAGTFDGVTIKVFINGILSGSLPFQGSIIPGVAFPAAIGKLSDQVFGAGSSGRYWMGKIDEVRVWNRALSSAELIANMNQHLDTSIQQDRLVGYWRLNENLGTLTYDLSGNNNNGTISSASQWTTQVPFSSGPRKPTISKNIYLLTCDSAAYSYQWFLYNNPILNATQQTYNAAQTGTGVYYVQVSNPNGCTTLSDPFGLIVGINELSSSGIKVQYEYQQQQSTISINAPQKLSEITLMDMTGRSIDLQKTNSENIVFTFDNPANGIYILKIVSGKIPYQQKIWIGN